MGERELIFVIYIFIKRGYNYFNTLARVRSEMQELFQRRNKINRRRNMKGSSLCSTFETSGRDATYKQLKLLEDFLLTLFLADFLAYYSKINFAD